MMYLWIDPALADTGIVWRDEDGSIGSKTVHTEPIGTKRVDLFKRWERIAYLVRDTIYQLPPTRLRIGMYAPIAPRGKSPIEKHPLLPMVSGICLGIACTRTASNFPVLRDDQQLKDELRKLGYRIPIVAKEGKGAITRYVKSGLWPECRNSHEGDARLGLEYLMITDGAIAPNPKESP